MIVTITGPSGCGKSTLLRKLLRCFPDKVHAMVSCTSRPPREKEVDGVDYHFVPREAFDDRSMMIEQVEFGGNLYGLTEDVIREAQNSPDIWIAVVEAEGSLWLKEHCGAIRAYMKISPSISKYRLLYKRGWEEKEARIRHKVDIAKGLYQHKGYDLVVRCNRKTTRQIAKQFVDGLALYTTEETALEWKDDSRIKEDENYPKMPQKPC